MGPAGPATSEPIAIYWPVHRHLTRFVLWAFLLLLLLRPVNRRPGVWKIALPAAGIQVSVLALEVVAPKIGLGGFIVCADELNFIAVALASLWLLAGVTSKLARPSAVGILIVAMLGVGWLQVFIWAGFTVYTVGYLVLYSILAGAIVVALVVSAFLCRKRWSLSRFLRSTCVSLLCLSMLPLPLVGFIVLAEAGSSGDLGMALPIFGGALLFLLGTGLALCLLVGTYLKIGFRNPELRDRFERIVRVQSGSIPVTAGGFTGDLPVGKEIP